MIKLNVSYCFIIVNAFIKYSYTITEWNKLQGMHLVQDYDNNYIIRWRSHLLFQNMNSTCLDQKYFLRNNTITPNICALNHTFHEHYFPETLKTQRSMYFHQTIEHPIYGKFNLHHLTWKHPPRGSIINELSQLTQKLHVKVKSPWLRSHLLGDEKTQTVNHLMSAPFWSFKVLQPENVVC